MRRRIGRVLVAAGALGVVAALLGTVVGVRLLGRLDTSLQDSVAVTATTLEALDSTVALATDALARTTTTLQDAADTALTVGEATDATVAVLDGAADVTGQEVAGSLAAVQRTLPALIDVAGVIDSTLGALDALPIGPTYDPDVPFDDALRGVEEELDGLPAALRDQAELLRDGADRLAEVRDATTTVGIDLRALAETLHETGETVADLRTATDEATAILARDAGGLTDDLGLARWLLAAVGLATAVGQLVPLGAGLALLDPDRARRLLSQ